MLGVLRAGVIDVLIVDEGNAGAVLRLARESADETDAGAPSDRSQSRH
jgi:hypothetical protein